LLSKEVEEIKENESFHQKITKRFLEMYQSQYGDSLSLEEQ
jgi:hypothetical protein